MEPSVKGSIFMAAIADVVRLRDAGAVSPDVLEARLERSDLALLEQKLSAATWYPMASYARLLSLLGEVEGGGREDYFRARGRANAQRLMDAGLYQQLGFIDRWTGQLRTSHADATQAVATFVSNLKLVITLARSIYNVGEWNVEPDPDFPGRVRVVVSDAQAYSEPMRLAAEGFLNQGARRKPDLYTSERPERSRIVFRTTVEVARLAGI